MPLLAKCLCALVLECVALYIRGSAPTTGVRLDCLHFHFNSAFRNGLDGSATHSKLSDVSPTIFLLPTSNSSSRSSQCFLYLISCRSATQHSRNWRLTSMMKWTGDKQILVRLS